MRAREFVTEKKIGTIQLKGLTIEIDDHIVDQALARQVHPKKVDIILRKLPGFKDKISKIPSGQKFWVYDSTVDAGLGFRCLSQEEGRYALKTTVSGRPWHSDTPIVDIKEDTHTVENFADGKKPGRKGLSRRVGIPKKATLGQLEKIAKNSTGERRRMAQWQLNMRRGKKK